MHMKNRKLKKKDVTKIKVNHYMFGYLSVSQTDNGNHMQGSNIHGESSQKISHLS